jgi:DNA repair ATPase RecN
MLGAVATGIAGTYYIADEYRQAYSQLLVSVDELRTSANNARAYAARLDGLHSELEELKKHGVTKEGLNDTRQELRRLQELAVADQLELAAHVRQLGTSLTHVLTAVEKDVVLLSRDKVSYLNKA